MPATINGRQPSTDWHRSLANAIRDVDQLTARLQLPADVIADLRAAPTDFPLLVPESYLARMEVGNPRDPLLLQVLPQSIEDRPVPGFTADALQEDSARQVPGVLQKYAGRVLWITTGACAVHCRYCFRRHYPYSDEPRRLDDWEPALEHLRGDTSLHEVLLSGGDPLMLTDTRLADLLDRIDAIPHVRRVRLHSRLPIVLPDRVTPELIGKLQSLRVQPHMVVHANHPAEIRNDCEAALRRLVRGGIPTLNQAVLLRAINDSADTLAELCERLINVGVMPYYLHQLDRVTGTAHFEVPTATGLAIVEELRRRLPGYAVPRYVQEIPDHPSKTPL